MQSEKNYKKKEDTSKYGEFVCSTYHWLPIEKQKAEAKKMEKITQNKKDKNSKK